MTVNPYLVGVQEELFAVTLGFAAGNEGLTTSPLPIGEVVAILAHGLNAELRPLAVAPFTPAPSANHRLAAHAAELERHGFAIATPDANGAIVHGLQCDDAIFRLALVCRPADAPGPFISSLRRGGEASLTAQCCDAVT